VGGRSKGILFVINSGKVANYMKKMDDNDTDNVFKI
jgi:hypothetical protein